GAGTAGGVRAMPAVGGMARKLKVDLSGVRVGGADGVVTMADVKRAAAAGSAAAAGPHPNPPPQAGEGAGRMPRTSPPPPAGEGGKHAARSGAGPAAAARAQDQRTPLSATGKPMRTQPPSVAATGQP